MAGRANFKSLENSKPDDWRLIVTEFMHYVRALPDRVMPSAPCYTISAIPWVLYKHPDIAATILKPFVTEANPWMIQHHNTFQGHYFFHHVGLDRNMR